MAGLMLAGRQRVVPVLQITLLALPIVPGQTMIDRRSCARRLARLASCSILVPV